MLKMYLMGRKLAIIFMAFVLFVCYSVVNAQGVVYHGDLSPAEGLIRPQERPYRQEFCLNGKWDFQPIPVPPNWVDGRGIAPDLPLPANDKWDNVKIKIPSPWNVNNWGGGSRTGKGTNLPYAPSSVYYPSYPQSWAGQRMGWLRKSFTIPVAWASSRLIVHFEAVAGECVVLVNGKEVGRHFDQFLPFDVDVTDAAHPGSVNEILVGVRHGKLFNKFHPLYPKFKATYPAGSNADDLVGIWQDVFIQAIPVCHVRSVFVKPDVEHDLLEATIEVTNESNKNAEFVLDGNISPWINTATDQGMATAEIGWKLGEKAMTLNGSKLALRPGETRTVTLQGKPGGRLKFWSPDHPELYTLSLDLKNNKGIVQDRKTERFGWRSFKVSGKDFLLNGQKIQCFGDLQHPFGPYITSRRFAWAWYKMIKDVGGNAVRPHAQPWPRVYYDLADEMGLIVLDETALFGSSVNLNFEEELTWQNSAKHLKDLILRDRNHPSVAGWSVGNELFAIGLLNKPSAEVAKKWDDRIIELAKLPAKLDPTRNFITVDGDKDMRGTLPVFSKHFGHGLRVNEVEDIISHMDTPKPIIVGESGATYYGKPRELFPFVGLKAYGSYYERNEALAIDAYQNAVKLARPLLSWFSPSELCWFGIEHMNLGYHDYSRLPDIHDGIFPGLPYQEGKPGYQFERIPPYVTTFNPGLDPDLPLYKSLPLFEALKSAFAQPKPGASTWDHYQDTTVKKKPAYPGTLYGSAYYIGSEQSSIIKLMNEIGVKLSTDPRSAGLFIVDGERLDDQKLKELSNMIKQVSQGGTLWLMFDDGTPVKGLNDILPYPIQMVDGTTTALQPNEKDSIGRYFDLRSLYFSELVDANKNVLSIVKKGLGGALAQHSTSVFTAVKTDWSLFNSAPEKSKCAQVVLYEHLQKPQITALMSYPLGKGKLFVSSIDYRIITKETVKLWQQIAAANGLKYSPAGTVNKSKTDQKHDLLMDGPVN